MCICSERLLFTTGRTKLIDLSYSIHHIMPFMAIPTPIPCHQGLKVEVYSTVYGDPITVLVP